MPATAAMSATATRPATATISLRSLDAERPPAGGGRWTVSDPVAYRQAVKTGNWVHTPYGLSYKTCVYHAPNHAVVRNTEIVAPSGAIQRITPCTHATLLYPGSAEPSTPGHPASQSATGKVTPDSGPCSFGTGGVWWAASCYVTPWYLWPANNSVIGASIHVNPVDTIVADLTASKCNSAGACTWVLKSTDENSGRSTSYTVGSDATFDLLIGSDMEVPRGEGCVETPTNGHAAFRHLTVTGNNGTITPDFGTSTPDPQCSISITQSATAADILWKP
jgi:hypothetical protein